jgi:PAS domain S-box-containing protein
MMKQPSIEALAQLHHFSQQKFWMYWPETQAFWWSDPLFELVGRSKDQGPDWEAFEQLLVPDDRQVLQRAQLTLNAGASRHEEVVELGAHTWLLIEVYRAPEGHLMGIIKDASERHWILQKLEQQRQLFELALKSAEIGIWEWAGTDVDSEGWWSLQFCRLLGYEQGEISFSSARFLEWLHPDDKESFFTAYSLQEPDDGILSAEIRMRTASGVYHWFSIQGRHFPGPTGNHQRMVGVLLNIHERKQAELELERRHIYQERLNQLSFAVDLPRQEMLDQSLTIACEYYGLASGGISWVHGEHFEVLALKNVEQTQPRSLSVTNQWLLAGSLTEVILTSRDGLVIDEHSQLADSLRILLARQSIKTLIGAPIWVQGKTYGVACCFGTEPRFDGFSPYDQDFMTYFCQWLGFMIERSKYVDDLQKLNLSKDRLLAVVAHDLRNPLSVVSGAAKMLDQEESPMTRSQLVGFIHNACRQADSLIQELLELSDLEHDAASLAIEPGILGDLILELLQVFELQARSKSLKVIWQNEAPELRIAMNPQKMARVIGNLLNNAFKFTPVHGQIRLRLWKEDHEARLSIEDTGIGIPKSLQGVLFDTLSDARRQGLQGEQSIGLGMSIVKEIIRLHGGRIQVFSEEEQGTCFRIDLPVWGSPEALIMAHDQIEAARG